MIFATENQAKAAYYQFASEHPSQEEKSSTLTVEGTNVKIKARTIINHSFPEWDNLDPFWKGAWHRIATSVLNGKPVSETE